ncbi:four-helix bundle copper-binding protein [Mycobacterium sp. KBS0706]|uniref:four-helix bundle copper-binding protein n=1 Tax=Mycobacterium sp. KBS0706 TaxID=2578109 RepID=UPI001C8F234E|nr:four-helix bundle copper-binding protein [Mycobacterium sp. KBS0706]
MRQTTGTLLRRLFTALALATSLAFGLGPAAALGSVSRDGDKACVGLADAQPLGSARQPGMHQASCCGMLCVPALAACADICRSAADIMLIGSEHHRRVCAACAEICDACAADCERVGEMQDCVDACRRCSESCRAMAA